MDNPAPDPAQEALAALGDRIERLALDPAAVRGPWTRLARPLLRAMGYTPRQRTHAAAALIEALRQAGSEPSDGPAREGAAAALEEQISAAVRELERNVSGAERACIVYGGLPFAHAAWLHRLHELVARAARAACDPMDRGALRVATATGTAMVLAPLRIEPPRRAARPREGAPALMMAPDRARRAALELAAIDRIIEAAQAEGSFLARRRRLLEAARTLLLDAAAAMPIEPRGAEVRRRMIAEEITRIDRLEAAGLAPEVGLVHQARSALSRGDAQRLHAALTALDGAALSAGDARAATRTEAAIELAWGGASAEERAAAAAASLDRSADEVLGEAAAAAVREGYDRARRALDPPGERAPEQDRETYALALEYLAPGTERAAFSALLSVDGCFDVGCSLSPVRVTEIELRARAVAHPTDEMILLQARSVSDLPAAIIEDPRTVLPSLATGRLLARKFIRQEPVRRRRTRLVGEARIYVLDGSTSMLEHGGARARVRDAILIAELSMLLRRFATGAGGRGQRDGVRVVLFYRYFTKRLGPVMRVDDGPSALAAIGDVLQEPRSGGTDIEQALVSSFELIRDVGRESAFAAPLDEGERDQDLSRAQVVLVTDGNAAVREDVVLAAREQAGAVPVRVSVIALGEENPALRGLVVRQRQRGERAFYHYVDDAALSELCTGTLDKGTPIHLPERRAAEVAGLGHELTALLDELAGAADGVAGGAFSLAEAARARREALDRDHRGLGARFSRWFPELEAADAPLPALAPDTKEREDLDAVIIVLCTVTEVIREAGGGLVARQADAIELLERLLLDARLSPARYHQALREHEVRLAPAVAAVRAAVADQA